MNWIIGVSRSIATERIKIRRTSAIWLIIGAPCLVSVLQFAMFSKRGFTSNVESWSFLRQNFLALWALFMLPMLAAVLTGLINALDHANGGWRLIRSFPVPTSATYVAKIFWSFALLALSSGVLLVGMVVVAAALRLTYPQLEAAGKIPVVDFLSAGIRVFVGSWLVSAIQFWLAARYQSLATVVGIAVGGTFIGLFQATGWLAKLWPWKLPINVTSSDPTISSIAIGLGMFGGLAICIASVIHLSKREVI